MCRLGLFFPMISHLCVQSLALATIFSIALPHALPLCLQCKFALSLPHVLPRAFARSPGLAIGFAARVFTPATYLPVFLPPLLPLPLPPSGYSIHAAMQIAKTIATAIACALKVCHGCCHQIWAPHRALFLNFI
jgi:hypothetical protein